MSRQMYCKARANKFNIFRANTNLVHIVGNKRRKYKNQNSYLILEGKVDVVDVFLRIFEQEYASMVGNYCLKCKELGKKFGLAFLFRAKK